MAQGGARDRHHPPRAAPARGHFPDHVRAAGTAQGTAPRAARNRNAQETQLTVALGNEMQSGRAQSDMERVSNGEGPPVARRAEKA